MYSGSTGVKGGEPAIDFTLTGFKPKAPHVLFEVNLATLLQEKPVVLTFGMTTCPIYNGDIHFQGIEEEYKLVDAYHDAVTFLHLYTIEPHPLSPNTNFNTGEVIEYCDVDGVDCPYSNSSTSYKWAATMPERLAYAQSIAPDTHPESIIVLDALTNDGSLGGNNPIFCTYATEPRPHFLITQDGMCHSASQYMNFTELNTTLATFA